MWSLSFRRRSGERGTVHQEVRILVWVGTLRCPPQVYQVLLTLVGGALTLAVWKWGVCTPERKPILEGMQKAFSALSSPHLSTSLDCTLASGSELWKHLVLGSCSLIYYIWLGFSLGMAAIPQSHGMRKDWLLSAQEESVPKQTDLSTCLSSWLLSFL